MSYIIVTYTSSTDFGSCISYSPEWRGPWKVEDITKGSEIVLPQCYTTLLRLQIYHVVHLSQTCVSVEILNITCDFYLQNNCCPHSICHVFPKLYASSRQHHHPPGLSELTFS